MDHSSFLFLFRAPILPSTSCGHYTSFSGRDSCTDSLLISTSATVIVVMQRFLVGVLQVMSIKAIGTAIKLTLEGSSQVASFQTWIFAMVAVTCIITQLNYLNKVSSLSSCCFLVSMFLNVALKRCDIVVKCIQ